MLRTSRLSPLRSGVFDGAVFLQHRRCTYDVCYPKSNMIDCDTEADSPCFSATFVKARDAFLREDRTASLGKYAFGFTWGAWAALFIATVLFFLGTRSSDGVSSRRWRRTRSTRSRRSYDMGSSRVKDNYA